MWPSHISNEKYRQHSKAYEAYVADDIHDLIEDLQRWELLYEPDGALVGRMATTEEKRKSFDAESVQRFYGALKWWVFEGRQHFKGGLLSDESQGFVAHWARQCKPPLRNGDLYRLARGLRESTTHSKRVVGSLLTESMGAWGNYHATVDVLMDALLENDRAVWERPAVKRSMDSLGELAKLVHPHNNGRLLTLAGKIARVLKQEDAAIKSLENAIPSAKLHVRPYGVVDAEFEPLPDYWNLSSPWQDLLEIYAARYRKQPDMQDTIGLAKYRDLGCELEDSRTHWIAAKAEVKYERGTTQQLYTTDWLYHTLKAAASSNVEAMTELGIYYSLSGWRYLADDVPEYVKPTPFDKAPPPPDAAPSLWSRLWAVWRYAFSADNDGKEYLQCQKASEELFFTEVHPHTAYGRLTMANEWYKLAMERRYAPAFLERAFMAVDEFLYDSSAVPAAALRLSPERYAFKEALNPGKEKNPFYDPAYAQTCLLQICRAREVRDQLKRDFEKLNDAYRRGVGPQCSMDTAIQYTRQSYAKVFSDKALWLQDPDTWNLFAKKLEETWGLAMHLCDQHGLDLVDNGKVYYKAKPQPAATAK